MSDYMEYLHYIIMLKMEWLEQLIHGHSGDMMFLKILTTYVMTGYYYVLSFTSMFVTGNGFHSDISN